MFTYRVHGRCHRTYLKIRSLRSTTAPHRQGRPTWPSAVNCYHPDIPLAVLRHIVVLRTLGFGFRFYLCGTCTERKLRQQKHTELFARTGIMAKIGIRKRHYKSAALLVKVDNPSIHAMIMHAGTVDLRLHSFLNFGSGSGQHHSPAA